MLRVRFLEPCERFLLATHVDVGDRNYGGIDRLATIEEEEMIEIPLSLGGVPGSSVDRSQDRPGPRRFWRELRGLRERRIEHPLLQVGPDDGVGAAERGIEIEHGTKLLKRGIVLASKVHQHTMIGGNNEGQGSSSRARWLSRRASSKRPRSERCSAYQWCAVA